MMAYLVILWGCYYFCICCFLDGCFSYQLCLAYFYSQFLLWMNPHEILSEHQLLLKFHYYTPHPSS